LFVCSQTFKKQWFVFKPSERLLLNYNKEEDALLGKVTPTSLFSTPPSKLWTSLSFFF